MIRKDPETTPLGDLAKLGRRSGGFTTGVADGWENAVLFAVELAGCDDANLGGTLWSEGFADCAWRAAGETVPG